MSTVAPKRRDPDPLRTVLDTVRGLPAAPLPEPMKHDVEARTGADLSTVRVHYTAEAGRYAAALGATAFTFGRDVVVGAGADTDTLRHEAVHAAQFARHGTPAAPRGIAAPAHPAQREADALGATGGTPGGPAVGTRGPGGASPGGLIQRQETPAQKKKAPTTFSGDVFRGLLATPVGAALAVVAPPELKVLAEAGAVSNAFAEAFVATVVESLTEADAKRLRDEFSSPVANLQYTVGLQGGIVAGVAIDVFENLKGLYEIAKLLVEYSPVGIVAKSLADVAMYAYDPDTYLMVKREEAAHAKQVIAAVLAFVQKVASDPTFLLGQAETMGAACGDMVSEWFHGDFLLKQSSLVKGYTVGKGLGIAATEVALLFLGPEEWVARGVVAAGRIAEGSKLYRAIVQILEKVPEMARLFKIKKELDEANNVLKAAKKVEQVGEAATEAAKAEKALAAAGDVPKDLPVPKTHAPEPKTVHPPEPVPDPIKPKETATEPLQPKAAKTTTEQTKPPAKTETAQKPAPVKEPTKTKATKKADPKPAEQPAVPAPGQGGSGGAKKGKKPQRRLKDLNAAEREAVEKQRTLAEAEADAVRQTGARDKAGLPEGWDYEKHPYGPKRDWLAGDSVNMPDGAGNYPNGSTVRKRTWKTKAIDEKAARVAGKGTNPSLLDPIGQLTAKELDDVAKTGRMPKRLGAEIEHERIPQRIGRMLEGAGVEQNEARKLSKAGDPSNLLPTRKDWHAVADTKARMRNPGRNPELTISLDDRAEFPLGSAKDEEIAAIIDHLRDQHIDLGATKPGQDLRDILTIEKQRRAGMAKWSVP